MRRRATPDYRFGMRDRRNRDRSSSSPPGRLRRRGFRLAAFLLPFCLLLAVEFGLRLRGTFSATEFWLPTENTGELTPNPHFGEQFVGRTLARMPRSVRVQEKAADPRVRVVVFGESAALGDPEPGFGMSRCLEALLEHRLAGRRVEVINTAMTALNSYAMREAARASQRLGADFWVIYAGNNEVIGPFGPASTAGGRLPTLLTTRLGLRLRQTAVGQWLTDRTPPGGDGLSMTQRWIGLEQFLDRQVGAEDPRLPTVAENFRANLRDTVELGLRSGARVMLGTMAVNLADCAPFASPSSTASATNDPRHVQWLAAATAARRADDGADVAEAISAWARAAALWPEDAETRYRLGQARLNGNDLANARIDLERARDLDLLRFRADSRLVQVTREIAGSFGNQPVQLVDAERELLGGDASRPPGADLFLEHVHLRPEGNYRLARIYAERIITELGTPPGPTHWLDFAPCLERLGWNPFAESRLWTQTRALCDRPPFSHQSNAELRSRFLDDRIAEANRAARPANLNQSILRVQATVSQHPGDWQLREQLARLFQLGRRWAEAGQEWRQIVALAPGHVVGWYQLGEALSAAGEKAAAQAAYEKALSLRPDFVDASLGLGLVLGEKKEFMAAIHILDQALRLSPRNLQARVNRGVALIGLGRIEEGMAQLKQSAQENPSATMPLVRLSEIQSNQKTYAAAADSLAEAVRRETNNAPLRHRLAIELSRAARTNESEAEFRRVIAQVPNSVVARVDLGVSLAQQARFREALPEFEAALRLQPTNAQVQAYLNQARAKVGPTNVP